MNTNNSNRPVTGYDATIVVMKRLRTPSGPLSSRVARRRESPSFLDEAADWLDSHPSVRVRSDEGGRGWWWAVHDQTLTVPSDVHRAVSLAMADVGMRNPTDPCDWTQEAR